MSFRSQVNVKYKDSIELKQVTNVWIMQDKDGDIVISSF